MQTLLSLAAGLFSICLVVQGLSSDLAEAELKNRPVSKVVNLLKGMLKQLEKEAEEDEDLYDKMACWCETNDKEKTKSISDARAKIEDLQAKIEELAANSARLTSEIKNLEKELAKNTDALEKATAIRRKQLAEFNAEEKDLLESISALKAAITVLSKHHQSLIQVPHTHLLSIATMLQHEMHKHAPLLEGVLTRSDRRTANSFIQAPEGYFDAEPTMKQAYAPQSGEIFGILRQMKDTFQSNLASSQKEESANQKVFEDLKAAKGEEIEAGKSQIETKTQELADTDDKHAHAKEDLKDTKRSLAADEEFLANLKDTCSMTDKEWEVRQQTRQQEMEAVSKALAVLNSDDAHDLFTKTFNPSLLQVQRFAQSSRRNQASKLLMTVAHKFSSPHLAAIAVQIRLDAFVKVKKAIDEMVTQLLKEQKDEVKQRDFCVDEFNKNQLQTEKKDRSKQDLTTKIEDLKLTIKDLTESIKKLKSEVAEMQTQLKRAGEDREIENKEFQMTVADQREAQKLLKAALSILDGFYNKKASLVQTHEPAGPPPPQGFSAYKKSAASGSVMDLISEILADAKAMEAEATRDEEEGQKAYETFVKETNASVETKSKQIVNKEEEKAKKEGNLIDKKEDLEDVMIELEQLSNYNNELHDSCDFVMKNFELRQTARDEEIQALKQAKNILSGAKFSEFLQS